MARRPIGGPSSSVRFKDEPQWRERLVRRLDSRGASACKLTRLRLFHGLVEFLSVESHHLFGRPGRVGGVFSESLFGLAEGRSLSRATGGESVFAGYFKPVKYGKPRRRKWAMKSRTTRNIQIEKQTRRVLRKAAGPRRQPSARPTAGRKAKKGGAAK
jgi:hypothetical protein